MRGRYSALKIQINEQDRALLQGWLRRQKTPSGLARRARAMLLLEQGYTYVQTAQQVGLTHCHIRKWARRFTEQGVAGLSDKPRPGRIPVFSPEVALYVVKVACERPDLVDFSLSQWDCAELVRKLEAERVVRVISAATIRRILRSHKLKPWRHHLWLSAKVPRDEHFANLVGILVELYTRPLAD
jgi:transposase